MSKFNKNFLWGAATAAYQVEGAWNEEGRTPCMWDSICHDYEYIKENGDVACDHYHRYKEDVQLMKAMGLKAYRFSISWSRLLPNEDFAVNKKGLAFYNNLIDELIEAGITPMATLLHFDTPMYLESKGGWLRRETIEAFETYASIAYDLFGDRVKIWTTVNEPYILANMYSRTAKMQNLDPAHAAFQASHYLLVGHAKAVAAYRKSDYGTGEIGLAPNLSMVYPENDTQEVIENAQIADLIFNQWYLHPALKGTYPEGALSLLEENEIQIDITETDKAILRANICDYVGVNTYSRMIIRDSFNLKEYQVGTMALTETSRSDVSAEYTEYDWEVFPQGMYDILMYLKENYDDPAIYITENGAAYKDDQVVDGEIQDVDRIKYLKEYIAAMKRAMDDGAKVKGYFVWTLMDNFEWMKQYSIKMGLIHVDFNTLERTIKKSGYWYRELIQSHEMEAAQV